MQSFLWEEHFVRQNTKISRVILLFWKLIQPKKGGVRGKEGCNPSICL